jgi:hypothetical protein
MFFNQLLSFVPRMKKISFYIASVVLLTACVSKQKYSNLEARHQQALNEKSGLEEVLTKVATENDSLRQRVVFFDSLYRAEHERNSAASAKVSSGVVVSKPKSPAMPKNVEYDKKALCMYNFPNYIYWPRTIKSDKFLIGIYGESALKPALAASVYGKKINELPAIVEPYSPAAGKVYHMIFVAESKQQDFLKLKKELKDQPVLLITENPYLDKAGAHICFYVEGEKVKFSVNKKHIEKSGMNVSDQLIKFAND